VSRYKVLKEKWGSKVLTNGLDSSRRQRHGKRENICGLKEIRVIWEHKINDHCFDLLVGKLEEGNNMLI
jgi:hypothetical protein